MLERTHAQNTQTLLSSRIPAEAKVGAQRLLDLKSDPEGGVEGGHRVLKDHAQGLPAQLAQP